MKFLFQFKILIELPIERLVSLFHIFFNISLVTVKKTEKPQYSFCRFLATQRAEINAGSFCLYHKFGVLKRFHQGLFWNFRWGYVPI